MTPILVLNITIEINKKKCSTDFRCFFKSFKIFLQNARPTRAKKKEFTGHIYGFIFFEICCNM
ncbi:hypothetical protein FB1_23680 [Flavobacterium branchiophilum NBRC 15030 = ATCC 35035]|nr:hypothetical protein FB1_23680 [Flavobacterium branchiophilum NBRC 15030 = ATCC 35035]